MLPTRKIPPLRTPYEIVPNQLSNRKLLEIDRRTKDRSARIFPNRVRVDQRGRLINPTQFIIAGIGRDIDQFTEGRELWLQAPKGGIGQQSERKKVKVIKSRKCCPDGKRYVLLEALESSLDSLEGQETIIYESSTSPNGIGVIHPGGSNPGGKDHSGQVNTYGVNLLVRARNEDTTPSLAEIRDIRKVATYERDAVRKRLNVAVLDSGILFTNPLPADAPTDCINSQFVGWDFVHDSPFPVDDHKGLHGTKISTIIKHYAPDAGIIPVKISNTNGSLTLYDALCGLEYARCQGATIINASWSFTGASEAVAGNETDFPLLWKAVKSLTDAGVIVVAAAGNKNQYDHPDGHITTPRIYPACYSDKQDKLFTITTVRHQPADPSAGIRKPKYIAFENYSPDFVDTGVLADADSKETPGRFSIPGFLGSYQGSSFATPIVVAKMVNALLAGTSYSVTKEELLEKLDGFTAKEADLAYAIREKSCYINV
ncbi:S8 family peptidase [Spirosoma oryzicola]|uniref:S8 family peptidase n=1 Tax=Spirosoma oryzicola TaxID=2898794 RepID=UPI001E2BD491|nr:S8 family serine peptidase [Spirosoma oryzicola]UHG92768.1 S8 family serine peptidase [Spirosoma oryzicola]